MMKKRIILIVACLMMVLSSSCLAANWVWAHSNDKISYFFDSDSIKMFETEGKPETRRIMVWTKLIFDEAFAQEKCVINGEVMHEQKSKVTFSRPSMTYTEQAVYCYDKKGTVISSSPNVNRKYDIIPDSSGDKLSLAVEKYAIEHNIKPQK
jgi:hypothetical protein